MREIRTSGSTRGEWVAHSMCLPLSYSTGLPAFLCALCVLCGLPFVCGSPHCSHSQVRRRGFCP